MEQIIRRISFKKYEMATGGSFLSWIAVGIIVYASDSFGPKFTWWDKILFAILAAFIGNLSFTISKINGTLCACPLFVFTLTFKNICSARK